MLLEARVGSHKHKLVAVDRNSGYVCDGCKQNGRAGWRYRCDACNYDMHNFCATAPPSLPHPFTAKKMQLLSIPVERRKRLRCSACQKSVSGLGYYGSDDALHPNCARLPKSQTINNTTFRLSRNLSSPCNLCADQRNRGWAYIDSAGNSIHAHCLIEPVQAASPTQVSAPLQLMPQPSTSDHRRSKGGASQALQKQPKRPSNQGVFRAICITTRLLLNSIYFLFSGDPSLLNLEVVTMISNRYQRSK